MDELAAYYAARANEYDDVYRKPERQHDIALLASHLCQRLADQRVLEIACGTGFWTERFAPHAQQVVATDINESVLGIARNRLQRHDNVRLLAADAHELAEVDASVTPDTGFNAGFAGFWWSHLRRGTVAGALDVIESKLAEHAMVVLADNIHVAGSNHPITRTDEDGNTYQSRRLRDGSEHEVLKNFPGPTELEALAGARGSEVELLRLEYFWCLSYRVA